MMIFLFCARDIFARDIEKMPVTILRKMPVTSKKWPWQISKLKCHGHKKMSRGHKKNHRSRVFLNFKIWNVTGTFSQNSSKISRAFFDVTGIFSKNVTGTKKNVTEKKKHCKWYPKKGNHEKGNKIISVFVLCPWHFCPWHRKNARDNSQKNARDIEKIPVTNLKNRMSRTKKNVTGKKILAALPQNVMENLLLI